MPACRCLPTLPTRTSQAYTRSTRQHHSLKLEHPPHPRTPVAGTFVAQGGKGDGSVDQFTVLGHDLGPKGQQFVVTPGSAKTFSLQLTAPTRAFDR